MPTNPLVTFFKQSMIPDSAKYNLLPVAFDNLGEAFNPLLEGKNNALLILLNEDVDVIPEMIYTNIYPDEQLRIIWHNETDNKKAGLAKKYKNLTRVAGFSHTKENAIYRSLLAILMGNEKAPAFVNKWQMTADLADFEELAATIQLLALATPQTDPATKAYDRYQTLIGGCPEDLRNAVTVDFNGKQYLSAVQKIEACASKMLVAQLS